MLRNTGQCHVTVVQTTEDKKHVDTVVLMWELIDMSESRRIPRSRTACHCLTLTLNLRHHSTMLLFLDIVFVKLNYKIVV